MNHEKWRALKENVKLQNETLKFRCRNIFAQKSIENERFFCFYKGKIWFY